MPTLPPIGRDAVRSPLLLGSHFGEERFETVPYKGFGESVTPLGDPRRGKPRPGELFSHS